MGNFTWQSSAKVLILAAAYFGAGQIAWVFCYADTSVSLVWLPSGIALVGLLLGGYRLWPVIALGSATLMIVDGVPLTGAVLAALGGTLAALTAAWTLQEYAGFDRRLARMRDVLALIGLGAVLPSIFSATIGLIAWYISGRIDPSALMAGWLIWWLGDIAGVLVLAPALLTWSTDWRLRPWRGRGAELTILFVGLVLASWISFGGLLHIRDTLPLAFLPFPLLVWTALRMPMPWVTSATLLTIALALWGTASGHGPFIRVDPTEATAVLWMFITLVALTMLLVGAGTAERSRAETRWLHAVESNPNAVAVVDREGRMVLVNSQMERIFGYPRAQLIGQPIRMLVSAHGQAWGRDASRPGTQPVPMSIGPELMAMRGDGTEFPVEVGHASIETDEGPLTIIAISDIAKRKQAEIALREERNFVSTVLCTVGALVVVMDVSGRIIRFNKACEHTTGYTSEEVQGLVAWDVFLLPEEAARVRGIMAELIEGRDPGAFEHQWRAKSGALRLISWSSTVLRDADGSVRHLVGTGLDITEQRRAEQQAMERQAALAHVDRLATAGELAASLAHELNQPLGAMTSYCDTALAVVQKTPDCTKDLVPLLNQACEQSARASAIIRHLRTFVRKGTTQCELGDINDAIRDTARFVETELRHRSVDLDLQIDSSLPPMRFNRIQIEQVLVNLLRNSFQAMDASPTPVRRVVIRSERLNGAQVRITVADSGPGLGDHALDRLFDIFETTRPDGLGLGLSISRSIIHAHGGQLWAESGQAEGAVFSFTLPTGA